MHQIADRVRALQTRFGLRMPIVLAPMAGASEPSLSIAVENAGSMGSCGALLMRPPEILSWANEVRAAGRGAFQINLWVPDPPPVRDATHEERMREFLATWGPAVPADAGDATPPDFSEQCEALLEARPLAASSVMGLFKPQFVEKLRRHGIAWFAHVTTVAEARAAEAAGADVIVAQGAEAGGHRGSFDASQAERQLVGLFSLVPAVVDAVDLPVIAAGGIADGRGIAAALMLGASAVAIGTGYLRCPEAKTPAAWADALTNTAPENTVLTRAFSGRAGRSIATTYIEAISKEHGPIIAPYPVQRGLTAPMRRLALQEGDVQRMQAWAGQSAGLAQAMPAAALTRKLWNDAQALLS